MRAYEIGCKPVVSGQPQTVSIGFETLPLIPLVRVEYSSPSLVTQAELIAKSPAISIADTVFDAGAVATEAMTAERASGEVVLAVAVARGCPKDASFRICTRKRTCRWRAAKQAAEFRMSTGEGHAFESQSAGVTDTR